MRTGIAGRIAVALLAGWGAISHALTSLSPVTSAADVTLSEVTNETRVYLKRVETLLASGQAIEAVDNLRRVMDVADGVVMEIESPYAASGFRCYLPLRAACQMKLADWHQSAPEALQQYRLQVDRVSQREFETALDAGDEVQLRSIVDHYFCSSVGDEALFWLGEFAFQRGDYATARASWERIHPSFRWTSQGTRLDRYTGLPTWLLVRNIDVQSNWGLISDAVTGRATADRWLAYPDSDMDLNKVRARLVLASIMEGQVQRSTIELDIFRRLAPRATGRLGGKQGNLSERLQRLLAQRRQWPSANEPRGWPTFAGASDRARQAETDVDVGGLPIWQVSLPAQSWIDPGTGTKRLRIAENAERLLSFHPVVADGQVLVGTDLASVDVQAFDLQTGEVIFQGNPELTPAATYDNRLSRTVPRFTMSAAAGRLYTCVASNDAGAPAPPATAPRRSRLVAIDLRAEGRLAFEVQLEEPDWQGDWSFAGAPLCDGTYVFAAVRRQDAFQTESHLACFDARTGRLCWRRSICASQSLASVGNDLPNNLLTLDEGILYYNTNAGAVAALTAADGEIRWIARYPRARNDTAGPSEFDAPYRFRDLNPCLIDNGLVYVAPADCTRLFALDAATGQLIWTTPAEVGADIIHLLGVGDGHLIASGEGLYWIDAYNGRLTTQVAGGYRLAQGHARQDPRGYGRGLLASKQVYWPTRDSIFVFEQRTIKTAVGWQPVLVREIDLTSRRATGGNLVMVNGILLVASGDHLFAFNESGIAPHVAD